MEELHVEPGKDLPVGLAWPTVADGCLGLDKDVENDLAALDDFTDAEPQRDAIGVVPEVVRSDRRRAQVETVVELVEREGLEGPDIDVSSVRTSGKARLPGQEIAVLKPV